MVRLAITLVHNKSSQQNFDQIEALLPLVTKVTETIPRYDDQGVQVGTYEIYHYEITNLQIPHTVRFYQVIPHGVTPPSNLYQLDSAKVFYGPEDADKGETRFFNWGLKRGTDQGADISIYLHNPQQLTRAKLRSALNRMVNNTELVDTLWCKVASVRVLTRIGQMKEDKPFSDGLRDLKDRITKGGLKHG